MTPVLAFDIETVPDIEGGRQLFDLPAAISDEDVAEVLFQRQRQRRGVDFQPLHLHRVVAIAVSLRNGDGFRTWSLGDESAEEAELLTRFFAGIDRFRPQLVSWNGSGFDLPVMHYRSLVHGIAAPRYWDVGDEDREFKWNNYLARFHWRHLDLMDVLAGFQMRAVAKLEEIAVMLGLPGKLGMHGSRVWPCWQQGERASVRSYCETDALNTYLISLRFRYLRGEVNAAGFAAEVERVKEWLADSEADYRDEFMQAWDLERFLRVEAQA